MYVKVYFGQAKRDIENNLTLRELESPSITQHINYTCQQYQHRYELELIKCVNSLRYISF